MPARRRGRICWWHSETSRPASFTAQLDSVMKILPLPRVAFLLSFALANLSTSLSAAPVGQFADQGDIGSPAIAGSTTYDPTIQHYRMTAGGINLWGSSDQFQFAWNKLKGDFIVRARFEFVGQGTDLHRKFGWMVRSTLDQDSAYADACVHGDGLTSLQYRRAKGAATDQVVLPIKGGDVIQLERRGNTYIFSSARYGETFVSTTLPDFALGDEVNVGPFLCSHNPKVKEEAILRDVRIIRPAAPDFRPYRDYLGSNLEILNVHTGKLDLLHTSAEPFEAPNWLPSGQTLIYNISGSGPNKGVLRT